MMVSYEWEEDVPLENAIEAANECMIEEGVVVIGLVVANIDKGEGASMIWELPNLGRMLALDILKDAKGDLEARYNDAFDLPRDT